MQIGSATSYVAPLPLSQAARPVSSSLSQPAPSAESLPSGQSVESAGDTATLSDEAASPARAEGQEEKTSPRETQQLRQEQLEIAELASRDREVRAHEQAHAAVGGAYAGAPTYTYSRGPDGKRYAIGGEVSIDSSPIPNDPEATLRKMELVQRAALAPAEPSAQDLRVAAQKAARGGITLVIYMGITHGADITAALMAAGLAGSTPAAVVQNGCTPRSRSHATTLRALAGDIRRLGIGSPAILVIGDVVRAAEAMQENGHVTALAATA